MSWSITHSSEMRNCPMLTHSPCRLPLPTRVFTADLASERCNIAVYVTKWMPKRCRHDACGNQASKPSHRIRSQWLEKSWAEAGNTSLTPVTEVKMHQSDLVFGECSCGIKSDTMPHARKRHQSHERFCLCCFFLCRVSVIWCGSLRPLETCWCCRTSGFVNIQRQLFDS